MPTTKKKDELQNQQNQVNTSTQQTVPAQNNTVQQAQTLLQQQINDGYKSQWQPQINDLMNQYLNRDKFSYDVNADALYNQLRDQYALMGQQAMMDTMGQATALTGGYGNSYAQGVGQQAYQEYIQQLSDRMPDLYQLALDRYINEGSQMLDNMSLMMQQDSLDYGRYRDQLADQEAAYQKQEDAYDKLVALMTTYGYEPTAEELEAAGMPTGHKNAILKPYYDALAAAEAASARSSSGSGNNYGYDTHGFTVNEIKALQERAGIAVDGIWGPDTQKAFEEEIEKIDLDETPALRPMEVIYGALPKKWEFS